MGRFAEAFGVLILVCATGLFSAGFATTQWRVEDTLEYGLWKICRTNLALGTCNDIEWDFSIVRTFMVRILMICAAALLGVGIFLEVISWCCDTGTRDCLLTAEAVFEILGGLFALSAAATYTALNLQTVVPSTPTVSAFSSTVVVVNFGYSLYLVYAAGLLFIIGGSIMCCAKGGLETQQVVPAQTVAWSTSTQQMPLNQIPTQNLQAPSQLQYLPA